MANTNRVKSAVGAEGSPWCRPAEEDQSTIEIILYDEPVEGPIGSDSNDYMVVVEEVEEAARHVRIPCNKSSRYYTAVPQQTPVVQAFHTSSRPQRPYVTPSATSNPSRKVSTSSSSNAARKGQWSHQWKICEENVPTRTVSKLRPTLALVPGPAKVVRITTGTPRVFLKTSPAVALQEKAKLSKAKQFKCVECGSSFSNRNYFREHLKKHGDESLWCNICSKEMCSKETLESHMRLHRNERPFACEECSATFPGEKNLREHIKRLHSGETFRCSVCGKELATADSLKAHESLHKADKPFRCRLCEAAYPNNKRLLEHTKRQHGDVHRCSICDKVLATKVTLEAHERLHRNEKAFACDECGKTFADKNYLREHQKRHKGRTFTCGQCNKQLATKSSLRAHEKLHNNIRPFGCDVCWATFAEKGQLKVHMRKHTGEKPYKCNLCNYAASQKHSVARHMHVKHGEREFNQGQEDGEGHVEQVDEDLSRTNE
ncbi:zinc finger protein-like [Tropilaelaps mercedesae]|uniref:Zinc finger protein-like n=1 Tax=Tropilaelaps mercedesae TaxID=418985 RepID=A0A1V9XVK5_9ACAR|nr:zinc finger protein-like [Tropilaelaps mercedesae]